MTAWSDFLPRVRVLAPGAPDPLLEQAVADAAAEFCRKTGVLTERVVLPLMADVSVYPVFPVGGKALRVTDVVSSAGTILTPVHETALDTAYGPDWASVRGEPGYWTARYDGAQLQVVLAPVPTTSGQVTAVTVVGPSSTDTTCDDRLLEDFAEAIASGALARVLANIAAPWGHADAALYHAKQFAVAINRAKAAAMQSHTPANLCVNVF